MSCDVNTTDLMYLQEIAATLETESSGFARVELLTEISKAGLDVIASKPFELKGRASIRAQMRFIGLVSIIWPDKAYDMLHSQRSLLAFALVMSEYFIPTEEGDQ